MAQRRRIHPFFPLLFFLSFNAFFLLSCSLWRREPPTRKKMEFNPFHQIIKTQNNNRDFLQKKIFFFENSREIFRKYFFLRKLFSRTYIFLKFSFAEKIQKFRFFGEETRIRCRICGQTDKTKIAVCPILPSTFLVLFLRICQKITKTKKYSKMRFSGNFMNFIFFLTKSSIFREKK